MLYWQKYLGDGILKILFSSVKKQLVLLTKFSWQGLFYVYWFKAPLAIFFRVHEAGIILVITKLVICSPVWCEGSHLWINCFCVPTAYSLSIFLIFNFALTEFLIKDSRIVFIQVTDKHWHSSIMTESAGVVIKTVLSILVIVDVVGNSVVCLIIKKNRDMRYA